MIRNGSLIAMATALISAPMAVFAHQMSGERLILELPGNNQSR